MTKKFFTTASGIFILALAALATSAQTPAADLDAVIKAGSLNGLTYTNTYFGLRLTFNNSWEAQDERIKKIIHERGKGSLTLEDAGKQAQLDEAVANTANLLMLYETPYTAPYRAKLTCAVEKIPDRKSFTAAAYLASVKTLLIEHSKINFVLEKDIASEMINGVPFTAVEFLVNPQGFRSHQKYYVQIRKGYVFCFILNYASKQHLDALKRIIKGIQLSPAQAETRPQESQIVKEAHSR
jgi:hypothetical protein